MRFQNAKNDVLLILSWFSEAFSRPSCKLFSAFIVSFIQLGKEAHTSSLVRSLSGHFLQRSLSSFTRFLGKNAWAMEEVLEIALHRFFQTLRIKAHSVLFLLLDDTLVEKTGKKIPGCAWHKDHAQNMANVFGHQWVLADLLYKDALLPLRSRLYHPRGTKGCGRFQTKITMAKRMLQNLSTSSLQTLCLGRQLVLGQGIGESLPPMWVSYDLADEIQCRHLESG